MPIIDVTYDSLEDTVDGDIKIIRASETYHVTFDHGDHPGVRKMMAWYGTDWEGPGRVAIPPTGSSHRFDNFLYVTNKSVELDGGAFNWKVTVFYESIGDPLTLAPIITYGGVGVNEQVDITIPRNPVGAFPITNSSDELFDPPVTVEVFDSVVTIVRNEETYNAFRGDFFRNTININTWQNVFPPEKVLLQSISAIRKELQAGFFYYEVTYVLYLRFDGWLRQIIDQGFRTLVTDGPGGPPVLDAGGARQYIELVDSEGKAMTQPTLLNGFGQKLPHGADAVKLAFLLNRRTDFDELGLPTI